MEKAAAGASSRREQPSHHESVRTVADGLHSFDQVQLGRCSPLPHCFDEDCVAACIASAETFGASFEVTSGHRFTYTISLVACSLLVLSAAPSRVLLRSTERAIGERRLFCVEDLAQKLLSRQPYATTASAGPGGFPADLQRPPGYPAFLATVDLLFGPGRAHMALVQSVLSGAFAMMFAVMVAAFTTELTGLLAGFLYAGDWVTIVHVPMTVAETVFAAVLGTAICLYALSMAKHRGSLALAAGFFLGAASLIKPISQLVVFAFLLGWAAQKKRRATGLIFLLSYVACVAPWNVS